MRRRRRSPDRSDDEMEKERAALVELCVDMHDRVPSEGLRDKVRLGLQRAGIEIVSAEGQSFDPAAHEALGAVEAPDRRLAGTVASTQRSGYRDHGRLVREPAVLVYESSDPGGEPAQADG